MALFKIFTAEKVPVYLYTYKGFRPTVQGTDVVFSNRTEVTENERGNFTHTQKIYIMRRPEKLMPTLL